MDEYLQKLIQELGEAINSSIDESESVNNLLERIRATGNEVFLVLEATIAFKEKPAASDEESPSFFGLYFTKEQAEEARQEAGAGFIVVYGSKRIGSNDEFSYSTMDQGDG